MWAGIGMMTLVAGAFVYFRWWTKAAMALAIGLGMIVLAQMLPDHGPLIFFSGFGVFAVAALLVLYAYHKGQLDKDGNGVPDFLEKKDRETTI
jgi:branched-subunit amino acid transport protein AzlD